MDVFSLTETEFFRLLTEGNNENLHIAYKDFVLQVSEICHNTHNLCNIGIALCRGGDSPSSDRGDAKRGQPAPDIVHQQGPHICPPYYQPHQGNTCKDCAHRRFY